MMHPVIQENLWKPRKWKSVFLNLLKAGDELKETVTLLEASRDERHRLTVENRQLKTQMQVVLATIRVTHNLDRVPPKTLLRR